MIRLVLLVTLVIAIISLLMNILLWIRINSVSQKRKELKGYLQDRIIPEINNAFNKHNERLQQLEAKMRMQSYAPQQTVRPSVQQSTQPTATQFMQQQTQNQQLKRQSEQEQPQIQAQQKGKIKDKHTKNRDKGSDKPQQPIVIKTIYLGINSDDFFFDNEVDEQKNATSKFIGYLTSETDGTFVPIDVERIRSANVAASVKQQGLISLKDAQTLIVVEAGKIRKEEGGWLIQSPAVVEFNK